MFILKIRGSVPGRHCWPDAPERYTGLRMPHSHNFGFELTIPEETARGIEFLELAEKCKRFLAVYVHPKPYRLREGTALVSYVPPISSKSCEELAHLLFSWAEERGLQPLTAEVNEDSLCGAIYKKGES